MLIALGIFALALAFGIAWINTRLAGLIWVSANSLGYQWMVEATRQGSGDVAAAVNLTLFLMVVYLSVMAFSGIAAAYLAKRAKPQGAA